MKYLALFTVDFPYFAIFIYFTDLCFWTVKLRNIYLKWPLNDNGEFQKISPFLLSEIFVVHLKFSLNFTIFFYFDNL